ncbi:MAG: magnesium chelatase [Bacteroidetes bacterium]|nr:MAG: magnesium chelatase [Bacteroidota bacterium]
MEEPEENFESRLDLSNLSRKYEMMVNEISKKLIGQNRLVEMIMTAILSDGHVLIEGVPGVAKTHAAKLIAKVLDVEFTRIQFTPDLMPSDVTGTNIFNPKEVDFEFKKGPIFSNIVLIDEINRAPAKTQAALLESMEERQITADGKTYKLDSPFIVLATQNPVEHEGTYKLPEAQLDRFLFKIEVDYPKHEEEVKILVEVANLRISNDLSDVKAIISKEELMDFKNLVTQVIVEPHLLEYIVKLVENTRENPDLYLGASPRASIGILNGSKALAALRGRDFITPDDIREVTIPVLNHRVALSPEREMEGTKTNQIIEEIINKIEVPR